MTVRSEYDRWRRAWRDAPPEAWELALAPVLGALVHAAINVVAVWVVLGFPARWGLRLAHHAFDAVESVAVASWVALAPATVALVAAHRRKRGDAWPQAGRWARTAGWFAYGLLACGAMEWVVGDHLRRQSDALLEGSYASAIRAVLLLGCGFGVVGVFVVGAAVARASRRLAGSVALAAIVALAANHAVMRDDYANVHAAVAWLATTAFGAVIARPCLVWLRERVRPALALALAFGIALVGTLVAPPNGVRLEMFRECGSVAPWVLARCLWRLPESRAEPRKEEADRRDAPPVRDRVVAAPVVVLLTVDALRADAIADPANDARFPNFARLKRSGFYVPRAVSAGSQTSVTLSALFSGRTFSEQRWSLHGAGSARFHYPATDPAPRLTELLAREGVRSEGFFALRFLAGEYGVTRGFSVEHMSTSGRRHATAAEVLHPMFASLERLQGDQPAFYFAHLTEPHEPYDRGKVKEGPAWDRYLSEVEVVDVWIGRLMRRLEQRARGRAYLIVSSDHGEAFGEHETVFHTKTLYDELLRVPILLTGPGVRAGRFDGLASILDVRPTVLDLFGVTSDPGALGTSLWPRAAGEVDDLHARTPVIAEGRLRRALVTEDGWKVIEDHLHKTVEAFDLGRDPGERDNRFGRDTRADEALAELRAVFEARRIEGYEPPFKP